MVDGHEINSRRLVVTDLDGTLIAGNTLHVFMRCALVDALRKGRLKAAMRIATFAALRAARLITHRRMKFGILAAATVSDSLRHRFTASIDSRRRPEVTAYLSTMKEAGHPVLLATAAADLYVPWIWDGDFVATPTPKGTAWTAEKVLPEETRGQAKLDAVRRYAAERGLELYAVITDHLDDLPLLASEATVKILVHPNTATLTAVNMAGIKVNGELEN